MEPQKIYPNTKPIGKLIPKWIMRTVYDIRSKTTMNDIVIEAGLKVTTKNYYLPYEIDAIDKHIRVTDWEEVNRLLDGNKKPSK